MGPGADVTAESDALAAKVELVESQTFQSERLGNRLSNACGNEAARQIDCALL